MPISDEKDRRKQFTVDHPFICVLLVTLITVALPFATYFPPLIYVSSFLSEATLGDILFSGLPFIWLFVCVFLLGRSYIYKKAGLY